MEASDRREQRGCGFNILYLGQGGNKHAFLQPTPPSFFCVFPHTHTNNFAAGMSVLGHIIEVV